MGASFWLPWAVPPWDERACCLGDPVFLFLLPGYSTNGYAFVIGVLLAVVARCRDESAGAPSKRREWWIVFAVNALPLSNLLAYMLLASHWHAR